MYNNLMGTCVSSVTAEADIRLHIHSQTNWRAHESRGPLIIQSGQGAHVRDDAGNEYIEAMSGLWCASLGFNDQRLAEAAYRQMTTLATYHTFNHRSNAPCVDLLQRLADISPIQPCKVFLANSGSEANETLVKLVWLYNAARGKASKRKIISRVGAFHGSTIFAAALSGLPHMHVGFGLPATDIILAGRPHQYHDARPNESSAAFADRLAVELDTLISREGPDTIGAMIVEPIMGAGGVIVPPDEYFRKVSAVLQKHDILLLADEVVCGFGRTGEWFGCQTFGFQPDMLSVAKGLSSGYMPISAVVVNARIYEVIADACQPPAVFGHGLTYSGHPVAAAVAAEALRIYREIDTPALARELGAVLMSELRSKLGAHPLVGEIRGRGLLAGVELVPDRAMKRVAVPEGRLGALVEERCRARGVIVRNMRDVIALCPPYVISKDDIRSIVQCLRGAVDEAHTALSS